MSQAEYGLARIIRPDLVAMKTRYQGKSNKIPLALPGTRDPSAGTAGYNIALIAGTSVPLGSKIVVWLPVILRSSGNGAAVVVSHYVYRFVWRMRNVNDFSNKGIPYHFRGTQQTDNTDAGSGSHSYTIPAALDCGKAVAPPATDFDPGIVLSSQYESIELVGNAVRPVAPVPLDMRSLGGLNVAPIFSDGTTAIVEQAINNQVRSMENALVSFNPVVMQAQGDELIILMNSENQSTWDFTNPEADKPLYDMLDQNPEFGLYLLSGTGEAGQLENTYTPVVP